jgi:hypothetical protein
MEFAWKEKGEAWKISEDSRCRSRDSNRLPHAHK